LLDIGCGSRPFFLLNIDVNEKYGIDPNVDADIDGNKNIPLQAGDALNIPANTMHSALAGFMGCVCFEYAITGAD
jgi:mannose-6-phosphate isomerase class I